MPAYVISEVEIRNPDAVAAYKPLAKQAALAHGGHYLAREAIPEALEGSFPPEERLVVLEFPNAEAARAWYHSDAYAEALQAAAGGLHRRLFIVDGLEQDKAE